MSITTERIAYLEAILANLKKMTSQGVHLGMNVEIEFFPRACADVLEALEWQEGALKESRAEVERLRQIMLGQETECRAREDQDKAYRIQITVLENSLRDAKAELAFHPAVAAPVASPALHPGMVAVDRKEWEILREGFALMRTAWNTRALYDYQNVLAERIIQKYDAIRAQAQAEPTKKES